MVRRSFFCALLITERETERATDAVILFIFKHFDVYMHSERTRESYRLHCKHFRPLKKKQPQLLNLYLDVWVITGQALLHGAHLPY